MNSPSYRSRKKLQHRLKALLHLSVFFTTGFIIAFVPPDTAISILSTHVNAYYNLINSFSKSPMPDNRSMKFNSNNLVIVITTTRTGDKYEPVALTRLAHSLAAVPPPLLWIVVEAQRKYETTAETLRGTKLMYRHITYRDNFTVPGAEIDHQRNLALRHIKLHRLAGIVHFTDAAIIYDLKFFEEMRKIKRFGVWPVAAVGWNRRKVIIDGPICQESKLVGWFSKDASSRGRGRENQAISLLQEVKSNATKIINVFGIGFNSSILWDPRSSIRTKTTTNTTKEFVEFLVDEAMREDENYLECIPSNSSHVMLWHLNIPRSFVNPFQA